MRVKRDLRSPREKIVSLLRERVLPWLRQQCTQRIVFGVSLARGHKCFSEAIIDSLPVPSSPPKTLRRAWGASQLWKDEHLCAYRFPHLAVVLEGVAEVRVGSLLVRLTEGTFLFVPPQTPIDDNFPHWHRSEGPLSSTILWLLLAPLVVRIHLCFTKGRRHWGTDPLFLWLPEGSVLAGLLQRELTQQREGYSEAVTACLTTLFWQVLRALEGLVLPAPVSPPEPPEGQPFSHRIRQALLSNLHRPWSLKWLADSLGLSPSHLRHRFKAETGKTLRAYVTEVRLQLAHLLLRRTDLPVAVVAQMLGFSNPFHFTRWFRRYQGTSPSTFRHSFQFGKP